MPLYNTFRSLFEIRMVLMNKWKKKNKATSNDAIVVSQKLK